MKFKITNSALVPTFIEVYRGLVELRPVDEDRIRIALGLRKLQGLGPIPGVEEDKNEQ